MLEDDEVRRLRARVAELENENRRLVEANRQLLDIAATGGRQPNTDALLGAALSGGDVLGLARRLADRIDGIAEPRSAT